MGLVVHNFFNILIERVLKYLPSPYVSVFWGTLFIYKAGEYQQGEASRGLDVTATRLGCVCFGKWNLIQEKSFFI